MLQRLRIFMVFEAITFFLASMIHFGLIVDGYEHSGARIPELVIGIVLVGGLVWSFVMPHASRMAALIAQGFALLGTFVGVFTIIIGVGPRTVPDVLYHIAIILVLVWGLTVAWSTGQSAGMGER